MALQQKFTRLILEALEDRTVPATLVSPNRVTFQDIDGDLAEVVFSKPVLNAGNVNEALVFNTSSVNGNNSTRQSLQQLNLVFQGSFELEGGDITVRVTKKAPRGDGEVHVGEVFSYGYGYGQLRFAGDVRRFNMYSYNGDQLLAQKLDVNSIGRFEPQISFSSLIGTIGTFQVRQDLSGSVLTGLNDFDTTHITINKMIVGGNIKGKFQTEHAIEEITINGNIDGTAFSPSSGVFYRGAFYCGAVSHFTLKGSVLGGTTGSSGQLAFIPGLGEVGTVYIGGSVRGDSIFSGNVAILGGAESLTINGSIIGGDGEFSGWVQPGETPTILVKGSILGGKGARSGLLSNQTFDVPFTKTTESVTIGGSVVGGAGEESGQAHFVNPVQQFRVAGSLRGGAGLRSGTISFDSGVMEAILQEIVGSSGDGSGVFSAADFDPDQAMHYVFVQGSIKGGSGQFAGVADLTGSFQLRVNGSVVGSTGSQSGFVRFNFMDTPPSSGSTFSVRGSMVGGKGTQSGSASLGSPMDLVTIQGDLAGNAGVVSGSLGIGTAVKQLVVGGNLKGGSGFRSGGIDLFFASLDSVQLRKNLIGGTGEQSGGVSSIQSTVKSVQVGGNIAGGMGNQSAVIQLDSIDSLQVNGSILGAKDGVLAGGVNIANFINTARVGGDIAGFYGYIQVGQYLGQGYLGSLWVGGSIRNSAVISTGAIGDITVRGSILASDDSATYIIAHGATTGYSTPGQPYLLNSLTVQGSVTNTLLFFGTTPSDDVLLAKVGTIIVGKNWQNSQLIVGYAAGDDGLTGTEDDVRLTTEASTLDSLVIAGKVLGPNTSLIQAALVSQLQLGQDLVALNTGELNDDLVLSQVLRVYEKA